MRRIRVPKLSMPGERLPRGLPRVRVPRPSEFDFSHVGRGEWMCAGSGAVLFVTLFLPWFGTAPEENPYIAPARKVTVNGWHWGVFDWWLLAVLLATVVAGAATALLLAKGIDSLRWAQLRFATMVLSLFAAILVVYRMIDPLENTIIWYGTVLGLLTVLGVLAGTQLSMVDERGYLLQREPRRRPPAPTIPPPPSQPKKPPGAP